jgi:transcriptional regulator with XRE-family HTH domain
MKDRNLARMAEGVSLARPTLSLIRSGKTMPSYDTLVKLSDYLERRP